MPIPCSTETEAGHCAGYEWAIITTGPPTIPSGDGCRTGSADGGIADVAQRGFWWFTRQQEAPAAALEALRKKSLVSPLTWHPPLLGRYRPRLHMCVSPMLHKNSSQLNAWSHTNVSCSLYSETDSCKVPSLIKVTSRADL